MLSVGWLDDRKDSERTNGRSVKDNSSVASVHPGPFRARSRTSASARLFFLLNFRHPDFAHCLILFLDASFARHFLDI